jgi:hypothetical protein
VANEESRIGAYNTTGGAPASRVGSIAAGSAADTVKLYKASGMLFGIGATINNVGPGRIQFAANYNTAENGENVDNTKFDYVYTDLRYSYPLHKNFSVTPRWRSYTIMYPKNNLLKSELRNRFELMLEGSF